MLVIKGRAAGVEQGNVYQDRASGSRDDRPGLTACLKSLRAGDVLVVSFAKILSGDWTMAQRRASQGGNVPRTSSVGRSVRRSEPALTSRSRTSRCGNNSS